MSNSINSGDVQAAYWLGFISRKEAQSVYDEFASAIGNQGGELRKLALSVSFLLEKFNITSDEFKAWIEAKATEAAQAPEPSGIVTEG
jgi:hypothetical protein